MAEAELETDDNRRPRRSRHHSQPSPSPPPHLQSQQQPTPRDGTTPDTPTDEIPKPEAVTAADDENRPANRSPGARREHNSKPTEHQGRRPADHTGPADQSGRKKRRKHVTVWRQMWSVRSSIIVIATPLIFLPIPIALQNRIANCAYVVMCMAVYWCTEALPMGVTALLPVAVMPWLNVADSDALCMQYFKDENVMLLCCLLLLRGFEKCRLNVRIGLHVLAFTGPKPVRILTGSMLVTALLSMWWSATACTAFMVSIVSALLTSFEKARKMSRTFNSNNDQLNVPESENGNTASDPKNVILTMPEPMVLTAAQLKAAEAIRKHAKENNRHRRYVSGLKLSVAYAASIGEMSTLYGTGPNIVLSKFLKTVYGSSDMLSFQSWFAMTFPMAVIDLVLAWLLFIVIYIGPRQALGLQKKTKSRRRRKESEQQRLQEEAAMYLYIRRELASLGKITFAEVLVTICYSIMALLWLTVDPGPAAFNGFATQMPYNDKVYVTQVTVAMTVCLLLFVLPSHYPNYLCFRRKRDRNEEPGPSMGLLDWWTVQRRLPWNAVILTGGALAIGKACQDSGLSDGFRNFMTNLDSLPAWVIVVIMSIITVLLTTFTSTMTCIAMVLPAATKMAEGAKINPLYMMSAMTLAASNSFVLPVSAAQNEIAFSYGGIPIIDMVTTGLMMGGIYLVVMLIGVNTWGFRELGFGDYPAWAALGHAYNIGNTTAGPLEP